MSQLVEYSAIAGGAANVSSLTLTANQVRGHTQIAVRNIVVRSMAMRLMQREWHVRAFCVQTKFLKGKPAVAKVVAESSCAVALHIR